MLLGMEIALFIMGIAALTTGKMTLWKGRVVYGPGARFLGLVALAPVPLSFVMGVAVAIAMGPRALTIRHDPSLRWLIAGLEFSVIALCTTVIYALGAVWSAPGTAPPVETEQDAFRRAYPERFGGSPFSVEPVQGATNLSTMGLLSTPRSEPAGPTTQQPPKRRPVRTALNYILMGIAATAGVIAGYGINRPAANTVETRPQGDPDGNGDKYDAADPPDHLPDRVDRRLLTPGAKLYLSNQPEFAWKPGAPGWTFGKAGDLGAPGAPRLIQFHSQKTTLSLSMHPPDRGYTRVCYYLARRAQLLHATAGLSDDDPHQTPQPTRFLVLGDGKLLWQSKIHRDSNFASVIDLDVSQVNVLELRTHVMAGTSTGCHAVWLQPYVLTKGARKN